MTEAQQTPDPDRGDDASGSARGGRGGEPLRVAVVGGGVSGLTAAWRLRQQGARVTLFEASARLGGVLRTERRGGFLIEHSADMFTTKDPWGLELCRQLEIESALVSANEQLRRAFVVFRGQLHPVPQGFVLMRPTQYRSMLATPLLSWRGKLRLFSEPFRRRRSDPADESLRQFVTRRLGCEVFDRIVQPLVGGIYTADPDRLSMAAAMPAFVEMERKYGSLLRAPHAKTERQASGARYGAFVAPRDGMQAIPDAIASRLDDAEVRRNAPVRSLERREDGSWRFEVQGERHEVDRMVLACGAPAAAKLLQRSAPSLSETLDQIPYAGCAVAIFGCDVAQIQRPLQGFGFVVPIVERRRILAVSFASHKFPGRAPDGKVLIRVFMGGACQGEMLELEDDELLRIATEELQQLIGLRGSAALEMLVRWPGAMPQYHVGHLDRVRRIDEQLESLSTLALAGNALRGVGVPFCIHSGQTAAQRIATPHQ